MFSFLDVDMHLKCVSSFFMPLISWLDIPFP